MNLNTIILSDPAYETNRMCSTEVIFMQLTTNLLIGSIAAIEIGSTIVVKKLLKRRSRIIVE